MPHLERTKSDLSEKQSSSKNSLDILRNNVTRSYSLPKESNQTRPSEAAAGVQQEKSHYSQKTMDIYDIFEERLHKYIKEYAGKYNECKLKLEGVQHNLQESRDQLAQFKLQWQAQKNEHQAILNDSEKVLADYEQLKSDPQKFEEEHHSKIDAIVDPLQEQFHDLQKKMDNLIKTLKEQHNKTKQEIEKEIYNIRDAELPVLREKMQEASITPTDKVYIQYKKYWPVYQKMDAICNDVEKELTKYSLGTTPEAQESGTDSLPEVTQINYLFSKVKQTQRLVDLGSWCSPELQEQVKTLAEHIEQLHQHATATQKQYNHIEIDVEKLYQEQRKFDNLNRKFYDYTHKEDVYASYYPIDRVCSVENIEIDSTLPDSCSILTARRGLSKLGKNIHEDATEEKIAQLVEYSKETGTQHSNIKDAYRHYGFDYIDRKKLLTIEQIDRITKHGHVVNVRVFQPGLEGHSLLIEGVERTNEGDFVVFFDPYNRKVQKLEYKYLERVSYGAYTFPSERQIKTREPILKAEAQAKIWRIWDCLRARSMSRR